MTEHVWHPPAATEEADPWHPSPCIRRTLMTSSPSSHKGARFFDSA